MIETRKIDRSEIKQIAARLKQDDGFEILTDLCGVDHLGKRPDEERFEVVYHLFSTKTEKRLRLKVSLPALSPELDSVCEIWSGANWFEREAFDLFGIKFTGHPDLRRILTFDSFDGHPLRKDYPIDRRPKHIPTPVDLRPVNDNGFWVNFGPAHPATHGTFRIMLKLDGEKIVDAIPEIGYLHRCFEKEAEAHTYTQIIPYTDRLNYCSAMMNNVGYCKAVEELFGLEIPERAQFIRIIVCELSRIIDHLVAIGTNVVDMGALTNFWYAYNVREKIYDWMERICGARLTSSFTRVGGVVRDIPADSQKFIKSALSELTRATRDVTGLLKTNRIFLDRTLGIGAISAKEAIDLGFTGPCLRAAGVAYDVRKTSPYYRYDEFEFEIPVGERGDTYDRIMVRFEEMVQSASIVMQALEKMPDGPILADRYDVVLPSKGSVYSTIEGMMDHFKIITQGITPPKGEIYSMTEAANGELGFYIVSDGSAKPHRIKVRPPCFAVYQGYSKLVKGHMIADAVAILGSLNVIAGELDR